MFRHFYIYEKKNLKKNYEKNYKKMNLLKNSKFPLLSFNFFLIYIIHEMLVLIRNNMNYLKDDRSMIDF